MPSKKPEANTKPLQIAKPSKAPVKQQKEPSDDDDDYEDDDYEEDDFDDEEEEMFKKTANEFASKLKEL